MDKRDESEMERLQHSNSILNSYIEKAMAREEQQKEKHNQTLQNIHDGSAKRKSEDAYRSKEMTNAINKSLTNSYNTEKNASDDFMNRHQKLLDKGREAVKRERNKTYFN